MTSVAELPPSGAPSAFGAEPNGLNPIAVLVGNSGTKLWGMSSAERLRRSFVRAGLTTTEDGNRIDPSRPPRAYVLVRADWVYDEALIKALVKTKDTRLVSDDGLTVALHIAGRGVAGAELRSFVEWLASGGANDAELARSLPAVNAVELTGTYNNNLRKREAPLLMPLTADNVDAVEKRTFGASYKGVTDAVTKYLWPVPARHVTKWCAVQGVTPNQVTFLSLIFVLLAFWLFWIGEFALALLAAWAMTFLDTVDGKLARVTLTSSPFGNIFDHGIDLIHPPFWWWAWFVGVSSASLIIPNQPLMLAIVIGGYVVQRIEEGIFIRAFGLQMHVWRPFDSWFRLITARRNPNLILLTASILVGRPDWGMIAVALWTAASLIVHTAQLLQAIIARRRGPLVSWLAR